MSAMNRTVGNVLASCSIDKDRNAKVGVDVSHGKVLVSIRVFLELGNKNIATPQHLTFPISHLSNLITALKHAERMRKQWELEGDEEKPGSRF